MQILRQVLVPTTNACGHPINDPMMEDSQKWYPIDNHIHIQDAVDAGIFLDFTSHLTPVSGPVIGKMVKNLLKIHNKNVTEWIAQ